MNTKRLLIASAFLLVGYGSPAQAAKVSETVACGDNCEVIVKVDSGCVIRYVDPMEIHVKKNGAGVDVKWKIYGPAEFKFAQGNGITFPTAKNNGKTAPITGTPGAGREVSLKDSNPGATTQAWQYQINITGKGGATCQIDPTVVNDDGSTTYF